MQIEDTVNSLQKLCWIVKKYRKAQTSLQRAKWRLEYLEKVQRKLTRQVPLPDKSKFIELATKIEKARLIVLKKTKLLVDTNKKYFHSYVTAGKKAGAIVKYSNMNIIDAVSVYDIDEFSWDGLGKHKFNL